MSTYNLNLTISPSDLNSLVSSGANIVVGKQIGAQNVAWIAFSPLQANSVTWVEEYGIYASTTLLQNGVTITQMSNTFASPGTTCTFGPDGNFVTSQGAAAGSYGILNQNNAMGPSLTFGLSQSANVNGSQLGNSPASAATVPFMSMTTISPSPSVVVWVQQGIQSGTVAASGSAPQTQVSLGGGVTQASLVYDGNSGVFKEA